MLYIPKIVGYLKNLTFSEYFKSAREKLCSKLSEEQNLRKFCKWFLITPGEAEKYVQII